MRRELYVFTCIFEIKRFEISIRPSHQKYFKNNFIERIKLFSDASVISLNCPQAKIPSDSFQYFKSFWESIALQGKNLSEIIKSDLQNSLKQIAEISNFVDKNHGIVIYIK
jgi:hypothetical protein